MRKPIRIRAGKNAGFHPVFNDYYGILRYWMLQVLVPLGAHKGLIHERGCAEDSVFQELGLSHLLETKEFNGNEARQLLQKIHGELDSSYRVSLPEHTQLAKNIRWLGKIIGLNEIEQAILHFRVIASRHLPLRSCLMCLGSAVDLLYASNIFAKLLDVDEELIEQAFKPNARLIRAGLIYIPTKLDDVLDSPGCAQFYRPLN